MCSCIYAYNNDANNINTYTCKINKTGLVIIFVIDKLFTP